MAWWWRIFTGRKSLCLKLVEDRREKPDLTRSCEGVVGDSVKKMVPASHPVSRGCNRDLIYVPSLCCGSSCWQFDIFWVSGSAQILKISSFAIFPIQRWCASSWFTSIFLQGPKVNRPRDWFHLTESLILLRLLKKPAPNRAYWRCSAPSGASRVLIYSFSEEWCAGGVAV